jgi:hypothetical protein
MSNENLYEGLENGELRGLVYNEVSIDQYKPKVGKEEETVVLAITVRYEKPAEDLANFLETSELEFLDVEASQIPNEEGDYKVFIEFERNDELPENIIKTLNIANRVTSEKGSWTYIAYKQEEPKDMSLPNLKSDLITDPREYLRMMKERQVAEDSIRDRMKFLINY